MKLIYLWLGFFTLTAFSQNIPPVLYNHAFMRMDSTDIKAMQQSFSENNFATFVTRTTYRRNDSYTNSYLYGTDNYFEIKGIDDYPESLGISGLSFGTEHTGEIFIVDSLLKSNYSTVLKLNEKKTDDTLVPWYTVVYIDDTVFFSQSNIYVWMMEFRCEYFDYYHFPYEKNHITTAAFLHQYDSLRKDKILKRFTSMTLKATPIEKEFYTGLFLKFGYKMIKPNTFIDSNNFIFYLKNRVSADIYSIDCMTFETTTTIKKNINVSKNIKISMNKGKGKISFNSK